MKIHTLKVSTISVLCVLCTGLTTNAFAAGSVRALGGAGTYDGAAAASASTRTAPSRAGSLRVTPSSARLTTASSSSDTTSTSGTRATSGTGQRLSIGKYLGETATTPASVSAKASSTSADLKELEDRVDELEGTIGADNQSTSLMGRVSTLEDRHITSSDGIVVVNGDDVSIDVGALVTQLQNSGAISSSRETEIQYTSGHDLQWRYTSGDDQTWHTLFNIDTLTGGYATANDLETAIAGLANTYATKSSVDALAETVALKANSADVYTKAQVDSAIETGVGGVDLSGLETTEHAAATYQPKGNYLTEHQSLAGLATTAEMNTALAGKANTSDIPTVPTNVSAFTNDAGYLTEHQSLNDYAKTADVNDALALKANSADVYTKAQVDSAIETGVGGVDLSVYETSEHAEATYQPKGNYLTEHQSLAGLATTTALASVASDLDELTTTVSGKASQSDLEALTTTVGTKASQSDLEALSGIVATKAAASDLETLAGTVAGKATTTQLASVESSLNDAINTKASQSDLEALTTTVGTKANSSDVYTKGEVDTALSGKQATISDLDDIRSGAAAGATAQQPATTLAGYGITDAYTKAQVDSAIETGVGDVDLTAYETKEHASDTYATKTQIPATTNAGEWVWGFVDGEPQAIKVVDANGN